MLIRSSDDPRWQRPHLETGMWFACGVRSEHGTYVFVEPRNPTYVEMLVIDAPVLDEAVYRLRWDPTTHPLR